MPDTPLPPAEQILQEESHPRPLSIEPWVAAYLSRVWQDRKKQISNSIVFGSLIRDQANSSATS
jgi:hypothetical protein